jgi:hypothetical protein
MAGYAFGSNPPYRLRVVGYFKMLENLAPTPEELEYARSLMPEEWRDG